MLNPFRIGLLAPHLDPQNLVVLGQPFIGAEHTHLDLAGEEANDEVLNEEAPRLRAGAVFFLPGWHYLCAGLALHP